MNANNAQNNIINIFFKIDGKTLQNGADLYTTGIALKELQYIFDKSYLTLLGGKKFRQKDRDNFKLIATNFETGSLSSPIDIITFTAIPLLVQFGPEQLWQYTKTAFEILQFLYSYHKGSTKKDEPVITINGNNNTVIITKGDTNLTVKELEFQLAEQVYPSYKTIAELVNTNNLDYFQIGDKKDRSIIRIDKENAEHFSSTTRIVNDPIELECELISFNKRTGRGRILVATNQALPAGEYSFFVKSKIKEHFLQNIKEKKIRIFVLLEITFNPFKHQNAKITRLHLFSKEMVT